MITIPITIRAKLSLGAISAINRTVIKLPPNTLSQNVHRRCFCCGSSVLHVVMSVCMFGAVQFLNGFIFYLFCVSNSFISAMVTEFPPVWERANNSAYRGWSGGAMVLGKLSVPGRPTFWMIVGQGPIALAVGAGGGCLGIFTLLYLFSPLSPSGVVPTVWMIVGQGPITLAVGAGGGCLLSSFSLSLGGGPI